VFGFDNAIEGMAVSEVLRRAAKSVWQRAYRIYGVRSNVSPGKGLHIGMGSILWAPRRLTVGDDVYIGKRCTIEVDGSIGHHVLIGNNVGIIGRDDHDMHDLGVPITQARWIGDHPELGRRETVIDDDVWIGYGATILSGVHVGHGAVVGAGSLVVNNVEPYSIVVGVPARPVAVRFDVGERTLHEEGMRQLGQRGEGR
jgi:acetyltransferase-like isoleucine patch superfamily enzyme